MMALLLLGALSMEGGETLGHRTPPGTRGSGLWWWARGRRPLSWSAGGYDRRAEYNCNEEVTVPCANRPVVIMCLAPSQSSPHTCTANAAHGHPTPCAALNG